MSKEIIARAEEIVAQNLAQGSYQGQNCILALTTLKGYPTASVITPSKADGIKWITFCTGLSSYKAQRIEKSNHASVCFGTSDYSITLVGEIEIITDADIKKEMWYEGLENHFTGSDDPNYCVLKFRTLWYNLLVDWKAASGQLQKKRKGEWLPT